MIVSPFEGHIYYLAGAGGRRLSNAIVTFTDWRGGAWHAITTARGYYDQHHLAQR